MSLVKPELWRRNVVYGFGSGAIDKENVISLIQNNALEFAPATHVGHVFTYYFYVRVYYDYNRIVCSKVKPGTSTVSRETGANNWDVDFAPDPNDINW